VKNVRVVEFRDISENKRAEKEKEELEGRLRQAQKMEAVGRLAGGVAHDFNNMLSVIIGHADMALEDVDPSQPIYERLEEIRKAGERSADLTRQLLAFARKQTISPKVLDLNKTVGSMINMLQRLIGEDIDLELATGRECVAGEGGPQPDRPDSGQPLRQCPGRYRGRGQGHHRNGERCIRRGLLQRSPWIQSW
jgi:two-component system cell cycle sensor histidine kinase/response regulator CckA